MVHFHSLFFPCSPTDNPYILWREELQEETITLNTTITQHDGFQPAAGRCEPNCKDTTRRFPAHSLTMQIHWQHKSIDDMDSSTNNVSPSWYQEPYQWHGRCSDAPETSDQQGITPYPLKWGATTAKEHGIIICFRLASSIKHHNAIGAQYGSYSIYQSPEPYSQAWLHQHRSTCLPPNPAWFDKTKIFSFVPWSHLMPTVFCKETQEGRHIRSSITVTWWRASWTTQRGEAIWRWIMSAFELFSSSGDLLLEML